MNQVTKKTATQQAMENLITYISGDTVQVGDKIPNEKDLCISLGVGRGTIREAVKVLISQGYLEIKPGLGTYVKSKTPQQGDSLSNWFFANEVAIQDIIIVRATLEPLATAMATEPSRCGSRRRAGRLHCPGCPGRGISSADLCNFRQRPTGGVQ